MTIDFDAFVSLFQKFPDEFKVFVVKDVEEIAALSVTIKIKERIMYNFYPADSDKYLKYSPSVMLHEGLYKYAQSNHYEILDLGIATDKGIPNLGLMRFKKNLGAQESLKLTFFKKK